LQRAKAVQSLSGKSPGTDGVLMRNTRLLAMLAAMLFISMAAYTASLSPSIPELQLTFSLTGFQQITGLWSDADMDIFRRHFLIDFPFLLSYGMLGYRMVNGPGVFRSMGTATRVRLALLLPVAALLDGMENMFHLYFIAADSSAPEHAYLIAGMAALVKWLLIVAFVVAYISGLARNVRSGGRGV
jgi:hypothetical protein